MLFNTPTNAQLNAFNDVLYKRGPFTRKDSLRGALTELRTCYDVLHYNLNLKIDIPHKSIAGFNAIAFKAVSNFSQLQLDLFSHLVIDSIIFQGKKLIYQREYNAVFVQFPEQKKGYIDTFTVFYRGKPNIAQKPPWEGGFVWEQDKNGKPWIGVACEGWGASSWWPLKDHLSDEPQNGVRLTINVPKDLMCVANGTLKGQEDLEDGTSNFEWVVQNPINSYNITLNIADYAHFSDTLNGRLGVLTLDYYVLSYNLEKAKKHFQQVKPMLRCFEKYFGPYPFYEDGYAMVETPYWGMEHQGAIAYGNNYQNNEFDFDFIIVHETGHEWYGNNISIADHGDLWVHEAFTTYMEAVYVECLQGKERALEYLLTQKSKIQNQAAIQGPLNVNFENWPDADMYYKGAWLLHTLRNIVDNDELWFGALRKMYNTFRLSVVSGEQIRNWLSLELGQDLAPILEHYLDFRTLPILEYKLKRTGNGSYTLAYRWKSKVKNFKMPIVFFAGTEKKRATATTDFQTMTLPILSEKEFELDTINYLIDTQIID